MKNLLLTTCLICFGAISAEAAIPVIDKAILTKKSRTQSVTLETADKQKSTKKNTEGIDCAVHEGDKKSGAKEGRKRGIAPTDELQQFGEFKGPDALEKGFADLKDKSFDLVGKGTATQQGIAENLKLFEKLVGEIGQTKTVKGAYDQNSIVATQNGLAMNNVVLAANMFTEAFNLVNQLRIMDESSLGKITSGDMGLGVPPYQCSDGTQGRGTQSRPCISIACTVSGGGSYPEGCFASWFVTPEGRTVTYVSHPSETIYVTGTPVPEPARADAFTRLIQLNQENPAMKRLCLTSLTLAAMAAPALSAIPVIDNANLAEARQITENTQSIMESDAKIMEFTQKTLAAVTGDRTGESGELKDLALGSFKMGAAPDLGSIISGGMLSFAGMGDGAQENVAKLINAMQLVKSISGLAGDDVKDFNKVYSSFVNVTATVMGLVNSTQGAVNTRSDSYVQGAAKIGSAKDLKGSIDQNSQLQAQNGMTINELIGTVNTATTAINQQNLDAIAKASALSKITKKADWTFD